MTDNQGQVLFTYNEYNNEAVVLEARTNNGVVGSIELSPKNELGMVKPLDPETISIDSETGFPFVNDQILITFKENVTKEAARTIIHSINGEIVGFIQMTNDYQVQLTQIPENQDAFDYLNNLIAQLNANEDIETAVLNEVVVNAENSVDPDPWEEVRDWNEEDPQGNRWGVEAIDAPSAWQVYDEHPKYLGEQHKVNIGVIDSGFQLNHEDLQIPRAQSKKGLTNDEVDPDDHGTHVAGTIGAIANNGKDLLELSGTVIYLYGNQALLMKIFVQAKPLIINSAFCGC